MHSLLVKFSRSCAQAFVPPPSSIYYVRQRLPLIYKDHSPQQTWLTTNNLQYCLFITFSMPTAGLYGAIHFDNTPSSRNHLQMMGNTIRRYQEVSGGIPDIRIIYNDQGALQGIEGLSELSRHLNATLDTAKKHLASCALSISDIRAISNTVVCVNARKPQHVFTPSLSLNYLFPQFTTLSFSGVFETPIESLHKEYVLGWRAYKKHHMAELPTLTSVLSENGTRLREAHLALEKTSQDTAPSIGK